MPLLLVVAGVVAPGDERVQLQRHPGRDQLQVVVQALDHPRHLPPVQRGLQRWRRLAGEQAAQQLLGSHPELGQGLPHVAHLPQHQGLLYLLAHLLVAQTGEQVADALVRICHGRVATRVNDHCTTGNPQT